MNNKELPVLLFGGPSEERLVSVASAQNVLLSSSFPIEAFFIDVDLRVHPVSAERVLAHQNPFTVPFIPGDIGIELDVALEKLRGRTAFIALHGTWGEDGGLQERLDQAGIFYTASTAEACRIAFDKDQAKALLSNAGYRVPNEIQLDPSIVWEIQLPALFRKFGPLVLKPLRNGSSIGLHIIKNESAAHGIVPLGSALDYIAEEMIIGREFTVGVIDGPSGSQVLPVSEVCMAADSNFDYSGKYLGKGSTEITPANIDPELATALGKIAQAAHELCGCRGYSRSDILVDLNGPVFLEINTHPGLSKASFIPQQLRVAGIQFGDFLKNQLTIACKAIPDRSPLRR